MYYVYLLRSRADSSRTYIGLTDNLRMRLAKHNEGGSSFAKVMAFVSAGAWVFDDHEVVKACREAT